jgi:hypothetical protein
MAKRLQYSEQAFERAILMAGPTLIALVEGINDIYFYEKILAHYSQERAAGLRYQVRTPREVSGVADGKQALLSLFRKLRLNGKLQIHASSSTKTVIFFADKDYDDYSGKRLRNAHLIYTSGVTLENALYELGDLRESLAAIIGRSLPAMGVAALEDIVVWKKSCAISWKEWIVYCLMCEVSGVAPRRNRAGPSKVHSGFPPVFQQAVFDGMFDEFAGLVGDRVRAEQHLARASRAVERALRSNEVDRVFCGKWYPYFLKGAVAALGQPFSQRAPNLVQAGVLVSHLVRDLAISDQFRASFFDRIGAVAA